MNLKYVKQDIISLENAKRTKAQEREAQDLEGFTSIVLALTHFLSLPQPSNHRSLQAHLFPLPQAGSLSMTVVALKNLEGIRIYVLSWT